MKVTVWRCTEECGNYYASSSMKTPDLRTEMNHRSSMNNAVGETAFRETKSRATCPDCGGERQPVTVEVSAVTSVATLAA